jgi:phosphohistidine phosphatase
MYIFVMRHGEAAHITGDDSLRPLTNNGLIETEKMGFWLAHQEQKLKRFFVSPYIRAQQSSINVINAFNKVVPLDNIIPETLDIITPAGSARQVHDFIDGLLQQNDHEIQGHDEDEKEAILFVSHMPFVSYLVGELTNSSNMPIFSTGTIAIIDYDIKKMQGRLVKMVSPSKITGE